ncbi:MAG: sulfotransferase, partial [Cytophaga sp.]|uniref:sulfotransferase n=1 Tax=Cytophaga sp. TaxID=29535 RepID=UPI003F7DBF33
MKEKINVIYILSNGRSGSTILDLLLGTLPFTWTMGELQNLPKDYSENRVCGCTKQLSSCNFWSKIYGDSYINNFGTITSLSYFRDKYPQGRVIRWSMLRDVLRKSIRPKYKADAIKYSEANYQLMQKVLHEAKVRKGEQVNWLVDASKDPYRLMWLHASGLFNIRVIHITKDPRALVYSMTNKDLNKSFLKSMRMVVKWFGENLIMSILCKRHFEKTETYQLQYEKMVSNTEEEFARMTQLFGVSLSDVKKEEFRNHMNHGISGNQARWRGG